MFSLFQKTIKDLFCMYVVTWLDRLVKMQNSLRSMFYSSCIAKKRNNKTVYCMKVYIFYLLVICLYILSLSELC